MTSTGPEMGSPKRESSSAPEVNEAVESLTEQYNQVVNAQNIFIGHAQRVVFETFDTETLLGQAAPLRAREWAEKLRKHTLLMLGGPYEEKPDVARQIARSLIQTTPEDDEEDTPQRRLRLREWRQTSDSGSLLHAIREEQAPAILLLHNVEPQALDYNVGRVRDEALRGNHLLLMTTERTGDAWDVALQGLQDCWEELHPDQLFDPEALKGVLTGCIQNALTRLPEGLFEQEYDTTGPEYKLIRSWIGGVDLVEIAGRLKTPRRIDAFVEQLCVLAREQHVTPDAIESLIMVVTSLESQITRWFDTRLKPDEQLLAIGLNFFDGLLDDQCFTALERWVADIRAHRDPTQRTYDYVDVENLKYYFEVRPDFEGMRFKALTVAHWRCLFRAAWRKHRRKIISALPVLAHMAAQSDDLELNSSPKQLDQLRLAVSDTLAEIGTYSVSGVQRPLLYLASSRELQVQLVAARAMAGWRGLGMEEQLFGTMKRWQRDSYPREVVAARIHTRDDGNNRPGAREHLYATLALTVAVAARYDPPNELEPRLMELVKQLAQERNDFVRIRFVHTLRSVTELHLEQCRDQGLLRYLLRQHPDLALIVGSNIAHAYASNRELVMELLNEFHAECESPHADSPTRITLLRTLAYVYGSMQYDADGPLTASAGFKQLQEMLRRERDFEVRKTIVEAVSFQALRSFRQVAPLLQRLMDEVEPDESNRVIEMLEQIYLTQRQRLRGGDMWMPWRNREYMVWMDSVRPPTPIEEAMQAWIKDPDFPAAQQIALRASLAFANSLDVAEAHFIVRQAQHLENEAMRNAIPEAAGQAARATYETASWYTRVFVPALATLFTRGQRRAEYRRIVSGLLSVSLAQNARQPASLAFVLEKWKQEGTPDTGALVEQLRSAMKWHPYAGWLPVAGGCVLLLGVLSYLF